MVKWENDPKPGWYDTAGGGLVPDEIERYHDAVTERCGIRGVRRRRRAAGRPQHRSARRVFLDRDFSFVVSSRRTRRGRSRSPTPNTPWCPVADSGDWEVIRRAGTEIRVPRKAKNWPAKRQRPDPHRFDPTVWGISA